MQLLRQGWQNRPGDHYRVLLPVGSFIVLTLSAQPTDHTRGISVGRDQRWLPVKISILYQHSWRRNLRRDLGKVGDLKFWRYIVWGTWRRVVLYVGTRVLEEPVATMLKVEGWDGRRKLVGVLEREGCEPWRSAGRLIGNAVCWVHYLCNVSRQGWEGHFRRFVSVTDTLQQSTSWKNLS